MKEFLEKKFFFRILNGENTLLQKVLKNGPLGKSSKKKSFNKKEIFLKGGRGSI